LVYLYTANHYAIKWRLLNAYQLPKMGENTTKSIGARVPMAEYIKIVATAASQKMSVADLILLKLYADPDPSAKPLQQAREQVDKLTTQLSQLETNRDQWMQAAQALEKQAETGQKTHQTTTKQLEQARQSLVQQETNYTTLTSQLQKAEATNAALRKWVYELREALIQTHNDSTFGKMGDRYWAIVDHYIPPQE
jgi:ABC-type transporter Mla subunit MlaD